eukprot:12518637-Alexandrium_andersonii.AAC.1
MQRLRETERGHRLHNARARLQEWLQRGSRCESGCGAGAAAGAAAMREPAQERPQCSSRRRS